MGDAADVKVPADDVAHFVDPRGSGGRGGRGIDSSELAKAEQEAMADAASRVPSDDIALRVDT